MLNEKSNQELLQELSNYVVGHTAAKKAIISAVNRSAVRHHQRWNQFEHTDNLLPIAKVLLVGPSGTGKTFMVETLCKKILDIPYIKLDATMLAFTSAAAGTKIEDVQDMITEEARIYAANKNYHGIAYTQNMAIDRVVVFIDEFDKLAWGASKEHDSWNKRIQANYLQLLEGNDKFSGVTFILAGAFSGIDHHKSTSNNKIGFNRQELTVKEQTEDSLDELVVKYGLIPEIVGRLTNIVQLDTFTRDDYKHILTNTLIPKKIEELIHFNCVALELSNAQIESVVNNAVASGQGVRYLKRQLEKLAADIEFDYENVVNTHMLLLDQLIEKYKDEDEEVIK